MDEINASEVRGDASNLKGTYYHLLYALWLLLRNEAESVHFFQGNDLLAKPSPPPLPQSEASLSTAAVAYLANQQDVWIQLKCTPRPWTCSRLLDDNLLDNFICNTFISGLKGRSWTTTLVTTSEIRKGEVLQFLEKPGDFPDLHKKLDTIVDHVVKKLADSWSEVPPSQETVQYRAIEVLRALAQCETMPQRVLNAEIFVELAFRFVDRQITHKIQQQLIGELLQDAAQGPEKAHSYDRIWMSRVTGHDFLTALPLEQSASHACDAQVASRLPQRFSVDEYAPRTKTIRMLEEFLHSPVPIFILTGRSGTGKSWILAHWAFEALSGRARLLIPGRLFTEHSSLVSLIANELQPLTSLVNDQSILQKVARPALSSAFGPFVVIIDDVRPTDGDSTKFARAIAILADDAKKHRIKLVISCQTDVLRNLKPFSHLRPAEIFQPEAPISLPPADAMEPIAGYVLDIFTDGELREAVSRRVEPERVEQILLRLRDPAFALLRNPYALNVFFIEAKHAPTKAWDAIPSDGVFSLLDRHIESLLKAASALCSLETSEIQEVLSYVTELLWKQSDAGISRGKLYKEIESQSADIGKRVLNALFASGVLSVDTKVQFSEAQIGARLYAHCLQEHYEDQTLLFSQLRVERDHDVVVHLVTLVQDPVKLATCMTEADNRWIPAISEGLAYCNSTDQRIQAALLALARRAIDDGTAADALGRFSLRSRAAWKELVRHFLSADAEEYHLAARALWSVAKFYPERVARAIRLWYRVRGNLVQDRKRENAIRYDLARALSAMTGIDSEYAATQVLKLVSVVDSFATSGTGLRRDEERLHFVLRDRLLAAYDQVRVLAYAYADEDAFGQFLSDLQSLDVIIRARAVNALELIGRVLPDRVQSHICGMLRQEQVPQLLARILWASSRLAEQSPETILEAIESNCAAFWKDYESSAAALAFLVLLACHQPHRVLGLLPSVWEGWTEEARLLLQELVVFCRFRCHQAIGQAPAAGVLTHFCGPAVSTTQEPYRLYQLRAELVSSLLECGDELGLTDTPLVRRFRLPENGLDFFKIDISAWIQGHEKLFSSHPRADEILRTAMEAVSVAARHPADVRNIWRTNARFLFVRDCLDVLIAHLSHRSDPESWVRELPHDWEILYVVRHLLEIGCRNEGILTLALNECELHRMSATAQASAERNECLIALQKIVPERVPHVGQEKQGVTWFFSGGRAAGARLAARIDEASANVLERLEEAIVRPADALWLERWNTQATCWSTILLSRAYSRMFMFRWLLPCDGVQLADSMLLALEALPHSPGQQEHVALYRAIRERLDGNVIALPQIRDASTPIVQSHQLAAEILARPAGSTPRTALRQVFLDTRGWWEDEDYRWDDDGTIQHGFGVSYHLVCSSR